MKTYSSLMIGLTIIGVAVSPALAGKKPADIQDVQVFGMRVEGCLHFAGEQGETNPKRTAQIKKALDQMRCDKLHSDRKTLGKKYRKNPDALQALQHFDEIWQKGMGEPLAEDAK